MSNSMRSFCIVLLLLACGRLSAQNHEHRVRNVVLVHGAWADGSGWKGVYDILVKDGYNVSIVQEPETSFKDDVAATKRVLAQQDGPCILVAHSYGGAVITEAGMDPHSRIEVRSSYEKYSFALGAGIGARDGNTGREGGTCDRG